MKDHEIEDRSQETGEQKLNGLTRLNELNGEREMEGRGQETVPMNGIGISQTREAASEIPSSNFQNPRGRESGVEDRGRGRERGRGGFEEPLTPTPSPSDGEREGAVD